MIRLAFFALFFGLVTGCGNDQAATPAATNPDTGFDYESFAKAFKKAETPYSLSDTGLLQLTDTTSLSNSAFEALLPDSVKQKLLGKLPAKARYVPLARFSNKGTESYFIIKVAGKDRQSALLVSFNKDASFGGALPFLVPDRDPKTVQVSTLDKSFTVSRAVSRKGEDDVITEGKDVYAYNSAANAFTLIMTDLLDDSSVELINPIDTFARKHPFAGDYGSDKTNLVSIRDGRSPQELNFYIHFEGTDGDCIGELKGTAFFTSSKTAVYRQGGDPCVLEFAFTSTGVTLKEAEGCGLHRGLKCTFDGVYKKIKTTKKSSAQKKPAAK